MAGGELYDVVEKRGHLPEDEARAMAKQLFVSIFAHVQHFIRGD